MKSKIRAYVTTGVAATLLPKSVAMADSFAAGYPNSGFLADGNYHTYCYNGLDSGTRDNADSAMDYLAANTDMSEGFDSSCGNGTDARIESSNLSGNTRGSYSCRWFASGECNSARIQIDEDEIDDSAGPYTHNLDKTIRHEIGHSVGLTHYAGTGNPDVAATSPGSNDDCMISGSVDGTTNWITYTAHHKDHIDDNY